MGYAVFSWRTIRFIYIAQQVCEIKFFLIDKFSGSMDLREKNRLRIYLHAEAAIKHAETKMSKIF